MTTATLPDKVQRFTMPGGDGGTFASVSQMARLVREGATDPLVRETASQIVAGVDGRNPVAQASAIRSWLAGHFQFLRDPLGAELLHTPRLMLTRIMQSGTVRADCDDAAILGASLARSIGLRTRFVVVGFLASNAPFRHVWAEASASSGPQAGQWVEFDVTRQAQQIPWDKISRTRYVDVDASTLPLGSILLFGGLVLWLTGSWDSIFSTRSSKR